MEIEKNEGSSDICCILFAADDAESPVRGRRSRSGGKCQPHGGHLLKVPASEPRLPGHYKPQGSVRSTG